MGLTVLFTQIENYFDTVFSVFSFSNNKFNLNRPNVSVEVEVEIWCPSCQIRMYGPFAPFSNHSRSIIKIELFTRLIAQLCFPLDIGKQNFPDLRPLQVIRSVLHRWR